MVKKRNTIVLVRQAHNCSVSSYGGVVHCTALESNEPDYSKQRFQLKYINCNVSNLSHSGIVHWTVLGLNPLPHITCTITLYCDFMPMSKSCV